MRDVVDRRAAAPREPMFDVPWTVLALVGALVAAHAARLYLGIDADRFALVPLDLKHGAGLHWASHLFVHANWAHVLTNAAFTLAFGTPVARYLGLGSRGALAFAVFFLAAGTLAALGFAAWACLFEPDAPWALVGASGAASGLFGAAARLMEGRGRLGGLGGRRFLTMSVVWIGANAVLGLTGLTPGAGAAPVAWQAHVCGFLAGLALIGPLARLAGRPRDHAIAP